MKETVFRWLNEMTGHVSGCMGPVIPLLMAGGLLKLLLMVLSVLGAESEAVGTWIVLNAISNAPFYFLPMLLAWSSSVHFKANPVPVIGSVSVLLLPELTVIMQQGSLSFAGIPIEEANYAYSVLPVIFLAYIISREEAFLNKRLKGAVKDIFEPFILFTISSVLAIVVIGPVGIWLGNLVRDSLLYLQDHYAVLAWMLLAGSLPLLIMTGLHWMIETVAITNLGELGIDYGIMVSFMIVIMAAGGMCTAVFLRSRDKREKTAAASAGITALFTGVVEPALYGVCLKDRKVLGALITACLVGGLYHGLVIIRCYVYAFPALFSFLMFADGADPDNFGKALIAGGISFLTSFILTLFAKRNV